MSRAWLEARGLDLDTLEGRPLVRGLRLAIGDDRVAVVGRNGAGKSALLDALVSGPGVTRRGRIVYLTQDGACLGAAPVSDARAWAREAAWAGLSGRAEPPSPGERRKRQLITAILSGADLLVLDEPTEDLDPRGVDWLIARVGSWRGGLVVVSHDPRLLSCFHDFFVVSESGCRHVAGALDEVDAQLAAEQRAAELRYAGGLSHLVQRAQDDLHIRRRRARKRALGRLHELARCTPRSRLNGKRGRAQVSQARVAGVRDDRITLVQGWARAARRALAVELPLRLAPPELGAPTSAAIVLEAARVARGGRELVARVDLTLGDGRIGVVGANGAGKSSLLAVLAGELAPAGGLARVARDRIGWIDQGAEAWRVEDRLADRIADARGRDEVARVLAAHRMPLALALRPMRSLSPGERARAALICLYARRPAPEVLLLDEPTRGLDRTGAAALADALRAWPGGLVVASHDRPSLDALRLSRVIDLDRP